MIYWNYKFREKLWTHTSPMNKIGTTKLSVWPHVSTVHCQPNPLE